MDEINEENIQEKINLFQQMQQQSQALAQQTSQIEMSINEIERTLSEIGNADEKRTMYRAIGSIMQKVENIEDAFQDVDAGVILTEWQQYANINTFRLQNSVQRNSVGIYSPRSRRKRIDRYLAKRKTRVWVKRVKYDVRKNFADSRLRGMFLLFFIKMYILVNVIIYIYNNSHN